METSPPSGGTPPPATPPPSAEFSHPRLQYFHRFPVGAPRAQPETAAKSERRDAATLSNPPSSPSDRDSGGPQGPSNANLGPAARFLGVARGVATAIGEASSAAAALGSAASPGLLPDPSLLTPEELKALKSTRDTSLANVNWKDIEWVKQRCYYTGNAYVPPVPTEDPVPSSPQGPSPPSPGPAPASHQPSLISHWFDSRIQSGNRPMAAAASQGRERQQQQQQQSTLVVPHGTGTLLGIVYGRVKHQGVPLKTTPAASPSPPQPSPSASILSSSAVSPFLSPAIVPDSLCPVEQLMPGCLPRPDVPPYHGSSGPSDGSAEAAHVILSVVVYDGSFCHGAFHGSGRLTVYHRYVLECPWCHGVPLLVEHCHGGAPCVLRSIAFHQATLLPDDEKDRADAASPTTEANPTASSLLCFKKRSLGYALWEQEPNPAERVEEVVAEREDGQQQQRPSPTPRYLSTVGFGSQYMGSLAVDGTAAASLFLQPPNGTEPATEAAAAAAAAFLSAEEAWLVYQQGRSRLFWAALISFVPDGFGEMFFSSAVDPSKARGGTAAALRGRSGPGAGGGAASAMEGEDVGRYYGSWSGGQRHGFGADWDRATGTLYVGTFHRNARHGAGSMEVDATGTVWSGSWNAGTLQSPASIALSVSPTISLQGTQWLPPGAKPSPHSDRRSATNPEPSSATACFAFDQGTLLKSRHSASGLWEPLFTDLDIALAAMPPVADELLLLDERGRDGEGEEETHTANAPAASDDTVPGGGRRRPVGAPAREPILSSHLDPIVIAVTSRPEWKAVLASFQRTLYFLYGRCPGGGATEGGTENLSLLLQLRERGRQTATAVAAAAAAAAHGSTEGGGGTADGWSTPSWCELVGLRVKRFPFCLQGGGEAAVTDVRSAAFFPAAPRTAAGGGRVGSSPAGERHHFPRPCLHSLVSCGHSKAGSPGGRNRGGVNTSMSLAHQRGLTAERAFELAMHAVASFVSSLRLRLVSYIAVHPAACDVTDHQVALVGYCWDAVYPTVAPLLHTLASVVVAEGTGFFDSKGSGTAEGGTGGRTSAALASALSVLLGKEKGDGSVSASARYAFVTACEGDLGGLYTGFERYSAAGEPEDGLTPEEVILTRACAELFSCPPLTGATCHAHATTHGPLLSLGSSRVGQPATAALSSSSLGSALDTLTALVHQTVLRFPESPLEQQQRLAFCLSRAAVAASAAGRSEPEREGQRVSRRRLREVGFSPLSTLLLLCYATSIVSPALPIPNVTALLSQEMDTLLLRTAAPREGRAARGSTASAAQALQAVALALTRIYYTCRPSIAEVTVVASGNEGLARSLAGRGRAVTAAPRTPLHELAARALFCLVHCGAQYCQRSYGSNPSALFFAKTDANTGANPTSTITITSEMASLSSYLPSEAALTNVQRSIRGALSLTAEQMSTALEEFWALCGRNRRVAVDPGGEAHHQRGCCLGESLFSDGVLGDNGDGRQRTPQGGSQVPELMEWILRSVSEWFLPPKAGGKAREPFPHSTVRRHTIFLHSAQQQASGVGAFPALMTEETFWYVQLLSVFLATEFGVELQVQIRFGFEGQDDEEEEEEGSESRLRKVMRSPCIAAPSPSLSPLPAFKSEDSSDDSGAHTPSPEKPALSSHEAVELSPTPDHPGNPPEVVLSASTSPMGSAPCSPPPPPATAVETPRCGRQGPIVGREVTLEVRLLEGLAGGLDWELLGDSWATALLRLSSFTGVPSRRGKASQL